MFGTCSRLTRLFLVGKLMFRITWNAGLESAHANRFTTVQYFNDDDLGDFNSQETTGMPHRDMRFSHGLRKYGGG